MANKKRMHTHTTHTHNPVPTLLPATQTARAADAHARTFSHTQHARG